MRPRIWKISIVAMIFVISINAQDSLKKYATDEARVAFAKKNILMGLRSGNYGVIEASLILIAKIKMDFSKTSVTEVRPVIDSIVLSCPSGVLRYKAYLTSNICADPEWFSTENTLQQTGTAVFFISASQCLRSKLLGVNSY